MINYISKYFNKMEMCLFVYNYNFDLFKKITAFYDELSHLK